MLGAVRLPPHDRLGPASWPPISVDRQRPKTLHLALLHPATCRTPRCRPPRRRPPRCRPPTRRPPAAHHLPPAPAPTCPLTPCPFALVAPPPPPSAPLAGVAHALERRYLRKVFFGFSRDAGGKDLLEEVGVWGRVGVSGCWRTRAEHVSRWARLERGRTWYPRGKAAGGRVRACWVLHCSLQLLTLTLCSTSSPFRTTRRATCTWRRVAVAAARSSQPRTPCPRPG